MSPKTRKDFESQKDYLLYKKSMIQARIVEIERTEKAQERKIRNGKIYALGAAVMALKDADKAIDYESCIQYIKKSSKTSKWTWELFFGDEPYPHKKKDK